VGRREGKPCFVFCSYLAQPYPLTLRTIPAVGVFVHSEYTAHSSSKLIETRDGMNETWKTSWESEDIYSRMSSEHK
jgi:hypothetical protein